MTQFIQLKGNTGYILAEGMEGCIVATEDMYGDLAVVPAPNLGLFCKPEYQHLAKPVSCIGTPNRYYFSGDTYELVDNPFAHWNALKSGNLH